MWSDGSGLTQLTDDTGSDNYPDWSPDGTKIAFTSDREHNTDIYVMSGDGTGTRRLTAHPELDGYPVWSPDGSRIAFMSDRDGNFEIYSMNADGTGRVRLSAGEDIQEDYASWSPDGNKLLFNAYSRAGSHIGLIDMVRGEEHSLTGNLSNSCCAAWQPIPIS